MQTIGYRIIESFDHVYHLKDGQLNNSSGVIYSDTQLS